MTFNEIIPLLERGLKIKNDSFFSFLKMTKRGKFVNRFGVRRKFKISDFIRDDWRVKNDVFDFNTMYTCLQAGFVCKRIDDEYIVTAVKMTPDKIVISNFGLNEEYNFTDKDYTCKWKIYEEDKEGLF